MNKPKLSIATILRTLFNAFLVIAAITLASLIGVGGAALWIYGRPLSSQSAADSQVARAKVAVATGEDRMLPKLTPIQIDSESPAQLTPARYMPSEAEIATVSDTPRFTYISYNGGRQQAHLRVNTVLATSVPAPLAPTTGSNDDSTPHTSDDRNPLSDPSSHYITNSQGRVVGIDGTAGATAEATVQQVQVARALPVQLVGVEQEVRVAAPVVVRKATPVGEDENVIPLEGGFNVQSELTREDDRPVLRALPVSQTTHSDRPRMFGASDDVRSFGSN